MFSRGYKFYLLTTLGAVTCFPALSHLFQKFARMTVETVEEHLESQCVHVENRDCNRGVLVNKAPKGNTEIYNPPALCRVSITQGKGTNN